MGEAITVEVDEPPFTIDTTARRILKEYRGDGYPGWVKMYMGSGVEDEHFMVQCIYVYDDYLETIGIKLLEGIILLQGDNCKASLMNEKEV